jgi:hypothetical protein
LEFYSPNSVAIGTIPLIPHDAYMISFMCYRKHEEIFFAIFDKDIDLQEGKKVLHVTHTKEKRQQMNLGLGDRKGFPLFTIPMVATCVAEFKNMALAASPVFAT